MKVGSSFGRWLRQRRKALDLTQADLADQVGCSVITIQKIEADARRPVLAFVRSAVVAHRTGLPVPSLLPSSPDH